MTSSLRILHLEDDPLDAEFIRSTLEEEGIDCDILRVETRDDFTAAIDRSEFDILFSDYLLPGFDGLSALAIAKE
jgi:CheY-like chemotaxis protein